MNKLLSFIFGIEDNCIVASWINNHIFVNEVKVILDVPLQTKYVPEIFIGVKHKYYKCILSPT